MPKQFYISVRVGNAVSSNEAAATIKVGLETHTLFVDKSLLKGNFLPVDLLYVSDDEAVIRLPAATFTASDRLIVPISLLQRLP